MTARRVVLATSNTGKLREMQALLATSGFEVRSQDQFGVTPVAETGLSFIENAILKARHAACATGWPALADDSGLVVDALDGRPGIYSARYAGADADDQRNRNRLLAELAEVPAERRGAAFVCVLAWLRDAHDPAPLVCEGRWHGRIATAPRGTNGFGYDPVFWLDEHHCTAAELTPTGKNSASHRGQALRALLARLGQLD